MLEGAISGFNKFFTKERTLALILFVVLAWAIYSYSGSKTMVFDSMDTGMANAAVAPIIHAPAAPQTVAKQAAPDVPGHALQPVANPTDLLPKDSNSKWSALNPVSMNQGDVLMPDLLQAGYHIGLDTIGQSLRNANLQLRSDPIISKADIGPWNQSTIEPDYARVPLEIGAGSR